MVTWKIALYAVGLAFDIDAFRQRYPNVDGTFWRVADAIGNTARRRKDNGAAFELSSSDDAQDITSEIRAHGTRVCELAQNARELGAEVQLSIVIRTDGRDFPGLSFDTDVLALLASASASLDIDIIPSL